MSNFINVSDMDRDVAILIYNGKIYEDVNHQYALETALKENGKNLKINLEENIDDAVEITCEMNKNKEIVTLSVFNDGKQNYLIIHLAENLKLYSKKIKEYAKANNMILGAFIGNSLNCEISL